MSIILKIQRMQANKQEQGISQSTKYRYDRANRTEDIPAYIQFKSEYEKYFDSGRIEDVKQVYQHGICGCNQHHHTVVVDRIGNIKVQELSKVFEDDELVHYTSQRLLFLSEQVLEQRQQLIWIIDLSGKIMQLASKKLLEALSKIIVIVQKYFPQILHKLVFVNTPMLFDTIWTKIAPLIAKQTLEKIVMLGNQVQNLYQYADKQILPTFLGGNIEEEDFLSEKRCIKQNEDSESQQQVDYSSLKMALSGLKVGGASLQSVSQTPLNTQADDK